MSTVRGTVVVTGASSGIGQATALHLGGLGFEVLAGVRKEPDGEAVSAAAAAAGARVEPVIVDVTDAAQVAALGERLAGRPLAGLVNNAGVVVTGPLEFLDLDDLHRQYEINVFGQIAVTQALLEPLRLARGRIVNISSVGGRFPLAYVSPYSSSKAAFGSLSVSLRRELGRSGIRVAIIEPGAVKTPIWAKSGREAAQALADLLPRARELYGQQLEGMHRTGEKTGERGTAPAKVVAAIEHALTAPRPRTRYVVGADARVQLALQALLPDAVLDRVVARLTGTR